MTETRSPKRPGLLLVLALLGGCRLVLPGGGSSTANLEDLSKIGGTGKVGNGTLAADATRSEDAARSEEAARPGEVGAGGSTIVSNNSAALIGTVTRPDSALIGNNSASLVVDVGGGLFYRLAQAYRSQALEARPVAGAIVSLVDAADRPVGSLRATADNSGRFALPELPRTDGALFAQATFEAGGKEFTFKTLVLAPASGSATADIDAASTLVAAKSQVLVRSGAADPRVLERPRLLALIDGVRAGLDRGNVPFMGRDSRDIVAAFDQLVLDVPEIANSARDLLAQAAEPADRYVVTTPLDAADLRAKRILEPGGTDVFSLGGTFEVDNSGNYYFPTLKTASRPFIHIIKLATTGETSLVGVLPYPIGSPVKVFVSDKGGLYVAGLDRSTSKMAVFYGAGTGDLVRLPGYLVEILTPANPDSDSDLAVATGELAGRMVADARGDVYAALAGHHVVVRLASGSATPEIFAGSPNQAGWAEGRGPEARFNRPGSLAIGPGGAVFVADAGNNSIRRIAADGTVSTHAGKPGDVGYRNGRGAYSRFAAPYSLAIDGSGNCFVSDSVSRRIRRISPDGSVFLVAGTGEAGTLASADDGDGHKARFSDPRHLAIDGNGTLYVQDVYPPVSQGPQASPRPSYVEVVRRIARP